MKLFVVGGGGVLGSCISFGAAERALADEIILFDIFRPMAEHYAFDANQALSLMNDTRVRAGGWEDMEGADVVLCAAGLPKDWTKQTNEENMRDMHDIIAELAGQLKSKAPHAVVITVSNPVDLISYRLYQLSGLPREQFLGYSFNDSIRVREAIANLCGKTVRDVECFVVGEHGKSKVSLYSSAKVNGVPVSLSPEDIAGMETEMRESWSAFLGLGVKRTAGWTSAAGVSIMLEAMYGRRNEVVPCSVIPDGEYGLRGLSIGLPAKLCPSGCAEIVELPLSESEKAGLERSAAYLSSVLTATDCFYTQ